MGHLSSVATVESEPLRRPRTTKPPNFFSGRYLDVAVDKLLLVKIR